jgi:NarL family two-component system response regulator LiaR
MTELNYIRVLIVDDHPMVRNGLLNFILAYNWMETVGEARDGAEAVQFCAAHEVDVVLMDMVMPVMDGSEATRRIMELGKPPKIIVLTSFHEQDLVQRAMNAGATSYLLKNVSSEELAEAIRAAHNGFATLAPEASKMLFHTNLPKPSTGSLLTPREREVLALLVKGETNFEISEHLFISMPTVKFHLSSLYSKLGAKNRVEAVTTALEKELVEKE